MSEQNPNEGLTWRRMNTDPHCDELRIQVAWGAWPYRITAYADRAVVQRFVPDAPVRVHTITRGDRGIESMMLEAMAVVDGWDAVQQRHSAQIGSVALR